MAGERLIGAIEAGGTKFVLAIARSDGTVLARTQIPTQTPEACFLRIEAFFREGEQAHGKIGAFGIASFGPIDIDPASANYGRFTTTPKPGWAGARFHDVLNQFESPIMVDTDVNGAALGEFEQGAGQGCNTLVYTTVGTGIGTGVLSHGQSLMGFSHYEAGHIPISRDRALDPFAGTCPFHGDCLEGLACGPAIEQRWGRSLSSLASPAAKVALIADYVAQLAVSLVLLHMPDRLIFGGGVMKTPGLIEALRKATEARLGGYVQAPQLDPGLVRYIVAPGLGDAAGITGAIALGRRALG